MQADSYIKISLLPSNHIGSTLEYTRSTFLLILRPLGGQSIVNSLHRRVGKTSSLTARAVSRTLRAGTWMRGVCAPWAEESP